MRCSISLIIISFVALSTAQLNLIVGDLAQHKPSILLQSRNLEASGRLQARSPEPGSAASVPQKKQNNQQPSVIGNLIQVKDRRRPPIGEMTASDKKATISHLESRYGLKSIHLPSRNAFSAPDFDLSSPSWPLARNRPGPGSSSRVAAYERVGRQPSGPSSSRTSSVDSTKRSQHSTSPAEAQVKYEKKKLLPGDPSYVAPSAFRASQVRKMSAISIPEKTAPRQREHWSGFLDSDTHSTGCFGCFGFFH